ncbi:MAG: alginate O-acetyltransferase AlgX-related protein [Pseudonocardiaceae bacterium]
MTERRPIDVHEAWLPKEHPLHRPRHGGRQLAALLCAGLFFLGPIIALGIGAEVARFENRPLAAFPDPRAGWSWFAGLSAWAQDHLPFRDTAVRTTEGVSRGLFGEPLPLSVAGSEHPGAPQESVGPAVPFVPDWQSEVPTVSAFPSVIEGTDGWLYLGAYVSGACAPSRSLNDTLASLHRLRGMVEDSGRQFLLVVAPDKMTMVPQYLPDDYLGRECASQASAQFWPAVIDETSTIDLRPALADIAGRTGSPVYSPADTHWTHEGGLAMTYALAERIDPGITQTWQVAPVGSLPWPDDISPLLGRGGERMLQKYSLAPAGGEDRANPVISDFRTALRMTSTPTTGTIDRPVRMIADSYSQFASPYLAAACTDITMVHPDTVAADPSSTGQMLAEGEIVVVEVAERHLLSGTSPILLQPVIDQIGHQLAQQPIR